MSRPGLGLIQIIAIKYYIENLGLSWAILFRKEEVISSCAVLLLMTHLGSGNNPNDLIFSRILIVVPFQI
jgi:hypothetical protein